MTRRPDQPEQPNRPDQLDQPNWLDQPDQPNWLARLIVELGVRVVPAGEVRRRYERELLGELGSLPRGRQLGFALGALVTAPALRHAVTGGQQAAGIGFVRPRSRHESLRCVLPGHDWIRRFTEDNKPYTECRRCGKVITPAVWVIDPFFQGGWGVR